MSGAGIQIPAPFWQWKLLMLRRLSGDGVFAPGNADEPPGTKYQAPEKFQNPNPKSKKIPNLKSQGGCRRTLLSCNWRRSEAGKFELGILLQSRDGSNAKFGTGFLVGGCTDSTHHEISPPWSNSKLSTQHSKLNPPRVPGGLNRPRARGRSARLQDHGTPDRQAPDY